MSGEKELVSKIASLRQQREELHKQVQEIEGILSDLFDVYLQYLNQQDQAAS